MSRLSSLMEVIAEPTGVGAATIGGLRVDRGGIALTLVMPVTTVDAVCCGRSSEGAGAGVSRTGPAMTALLTEEVVAIEVVLGALDPPHALKQTAETAILMELANLVIRNVFMIWPSSVVTGGRMGAVNKCYAQSIDFREENINDV